MSAATRNPDRATGDRAFHEQTLIGQLLKAPGQLDRASILEPSDFASPDHRAWLTALRALAHHRGCLADDDLSAAIEAVSELTNRPLAEVHTQAAALIEQAWSTANTYDDAIRVKRLSAEAQFDAAADSHDIKKTRAALAVIDSLDAIKAGTKDKDRFTAAELLRMEFPDPVWLLPDLLPETGLYLLCGKPKSGKSWLALGVAMALAQGGRYLDRDTPRRKACYFALEDTPRRLKTRLAKLHMGGFPDDLMDLDIRTSAPRLGKGLEQQIRQAAAEGCKIVILDTLQKIRPPASKHGTQYGDDYAVLGAIKDIADECGICILVIHHLRKAESLDDPFDDISGTNGVAGSADGALILRRVHGKPEATLHVTGRDLPDGEFGIRFDDGLWSYAGTAAEVRTTAEQSEIIDALKSHGSDGATIKTLCDDIGKQRRNVAKLLGKLVDAKLVRIRRAKPADFFALCDGPMAGRTTGTTTHTDSLEREGEERVCVETHKLSSTGSTGSTGTTGTTGTTPETSRGVTGGTMGIPGTEPENSKANGGTCGTGGTGGTGTSTTSTKWAQAQEINRQRAKESLAGMVELPGGGWMIPAAPVEPPPAPVDSTPTPPDNPDILPDMPSAPPAETSSTTDACADKRPDISSDTPPPAKPLSPLDQDIIRYLSGVAGTATEEEIHRQVHKGQQGRTPAMARVALHKLVTAGLVDKINGQYRLARVAA